MVEWWSMLMPLLNTRLGSLLKHLVILLLKGEDSFVFRTGISFP